MLTPSIPVAEVRKSPDIGQVHGEANDRQEEVELGVPRLSLLVLDPILFFLFFWRILKQNVTK